jgi:mycothiol synthase
MVRLRDSRRSDLQGILAVHNASAELEASQGYSTRESLEAYWRRDRQYELKVLEASGQIVAYAGLRPWHSPGWLQIEIAVHPQWRGRGLGQGLLGRLIKSARARGALYLCAVAADTPGEGARFLARHGFLPHVPRQHMRLRPPVVPVVPEVAGFRLRLATGGDCAALSEVNNEAYAAGERVGLANAAGYRRFLAETGARVWVAEEQAGRVIAGLCEVRRTEVVLDGAATNTGHIGSLAVRPSYQRRGLGRWLLAQGIALCRDAGWPTVELNVDRDNTPALRLYERAGFQPLYAFTVYRRSLA